MADLPLSRAHAAPPVRLLPLGLGNFFRAHPAWYTHHASPESGIAAFTGRSWSPLVDALNARDGLYTLVSRGRDRDRFEVVGSLVRAHAAADHATWLRCFEDP